MISILGLRKSKSKKSRNTTTGSPMFSISSRKMKYWLVKNLDGTSILQPVTMPNQLKNQVLNQEQIIYEQNILIKMVFKSSIELSSDFGTIT